MFAGGISPEGWPWDSSTGGVSGWVSWRAGGWCALGGMCTRELNGASPFSFFISANLLGIAVSVDMGWVTRIF